MNIIYRVYYSADNGEFIAYIGRTRNNLTQRIRQHYFTHLFMRTLDINKTTRIEYTEFATVADMYIAEIILINEYKPPLNVDDKAKDEITLDIHLPPLEWKIWDKPHLIRKWAKRMGK
jgi:excinuclease UvrABC nuclease subunit